MARCLIIGCGCRGLGLARELQAQGHVVRGTTRSPERLPEIEAAGAEPHHGDPDRLATIFPALAHVTVAYVLLGSATGPPESLRALHSDRLESLVFKMIDTTVHAIVYEAAGSVAPELLAAGGEIVSRLCEQSRIPYRLLDADPADPGAWVTAAAAAGAATLV
jgi:uncharacterized protein YbjT (DUF2867 family)